MDGEYQEIASWGRVGVSIMSYRREKTVVLLVKELICGCDHWPGSPVLGLPLVLCPGEDRSPWLGSLLLQYDLSQSNMCLVKHFFVCSLPLGSAEDMKIIRAGPLVSRRC